MRIGAWLGELARESFRVDQDVRAPFVSSELPSPLVLQWSTVARVLAREPDVLIVKNGRTLEQPIPRTLDALHALRANGGGLVVRRAEDHDDMIGELCADVATRVNAAVTAQIFVTAGGTHGFGWHYDAEDVFLLQACGTKEFHLRRNTVDPMATAPLPRDLRFERERTPVVTCTLGAAQLLHLPRGVWHMASCLADSLSLSVGVARERAPTPRRTACASTT